MSIRITLVRHGRSEANEANLWQGQGNAALSEQGRSQVSSLSRRIGRRHFDLVVSSDLDRASDTARAVSEEPEIDKAWREMDLGTWEGRSFSEVAALHPDLLEAIRNGDALAFGETGETLGEFERRALDALDGLVDRLDDGESALVATHGGVIDAIVGRYLGRVDGRRTVPITTNTALTVLEGRPGSLKLAVFNDATHLGIDVGYLGRMREAETPILAFVRHGITAANKEGRIQGRMCWGLDEEGFAQASALADWYPRPDRVLSSPSQRAVETASAFGTLVEHVPDVVEMSFGSWEGLRREDLPEDTAQAFRDDLPRGETGETFVDVVARMGRFLSAAQPEDRTVVVSHGAAIRAAIASIVERGNDLNRDLAVARNSSVTHVAFTPDGPILADYSLAPHLEDD
ncbi:MAG: histidine phosphatase family protein [Acidimicrobiia bacterium]|nr:histidine phosphatase family protein [Acidimicrobiia bacterium]MDH4307933.1 histidine phosphatase family protein [Acidimicrobiia bacterium]MDH5292246.1 histidine phosphatase family protein [Acidimicrobiia bacterium]